MVAGIVNNILQQINQNPDSEEIKKLLFLKLEMELSGSRCVWKDPRPRQKDHTFVEVVNE
jgi:hypothetical protein